MDERAYPWVRIDIRANVHEELVEIEPTALAKPHAAGPRGHHPTPDEAAGAWSSVDRIAQRPIDEGRSSVASPSDWRYRGTNTGPSTSARSSLDEP